MINYAPFCKKQVAYLQRCYNNWLNVTEGGKRAGKNVLNIMGWCEVLETHPDKLHLAAGVSVASAKLNIIDSNGFGVKNWFEGRCRAGKYQERDALYIYTAVGEKVILISGGGKEGDERYIKGNTYGTAYVTEVNECAKSFVKEVFDRTLSSANRKIFLDLNPKAPNHWFYVDILDMHKANSEKYPDYGFNYEHFTLHDNFSFTGEKIKELVRTYAKNTVWYIRDILGKRTNAEGIIYDMCGPQNQYEDGQGPDYSLFYRRFYAIDAGTVNPFACLEIIEQTIEQVIHYYVENEYYYDSKKHNKQKDDTEYAEDVIKFIDGKKYVCIIVDPAAASLKVALRKHSQKPRETEDVINGKNEIIQGIRLVSSLLRMIARDKKPYLLVNKTKCPNLCNEFLSYIWNDKASERGQEEPLDKFNHALAALRYFCKTVIKFIPGVR